MRITSAYLRTTAASLAAVTVLLGTIPRSALAQLSGYTFSSLATIPGAAPGGGVFDIDFEPYQLNHRGDAAFVADLAPAGTGEGVFFGSKDQLSQIIRSGQPAPGGGTFDTFEMGPLGLNDQGDIVFGFSLNAASVPIGINAGFYRFARAANSVTAIVVPGVTAAPGGGAFLGVGFGATLNNRGDALFPGIVPTSAGISGGLGMGIFRADVSGISSVVVPGDPAPGGGSFNFANDASINEGGDIVFGAHVATDPCIDFGVPQSVVIFCAQSLYTLRSSTHLVESIAHQGSPAPGGGTLRYALRPVINNQGQILFTGDLTPAPAFGTQLAVFLYSNGVTTAVARPGDPMPGGGHFVSTNLSGTNSINARGDIAFSATLDTDVNSDGAPDSGLYVWSRGVLQLVARTGTVIPSIGTIARLDPPGLGPQPMIEFGAASNDAGQLLFEATLTDGRGVLLIATP